MRSRRLLCLVSLVLVIGCDDQEKRTSPLEEFDVKDDRKVESPPILDENGDPIPAFKLVDVEPAPVKVLPPEITMVTLKVVAPVEARVRDASDEAIVSMTNDEFEVMLSEHTVDMFVEAEGYEPFFFQVVPNADKVVMAEMVEVRTAQIDPDPKPVPTTSKKGDPFSGKRADPQQKKMDDLGDDLEDVLDALESEKGKSKKRKK